MGQPWIKMCQCVMKYPTDPQPTVEFHISKPIIVEIIGGKVIRLYASSKIQTLSQHLKQYKSGNQCAK